MHGLGESNFTYGIGSCLNVRVCAALLAIHPSTHIVTFVASITHAYHFEIALQHIMKSLTLSIISFVSID